MCRVLSYLGEPLPLEDLLYKPDVSFVNQTHQATLLHRLNLAGSGLLAWDAGSREPDLPFVYRSTALAIYDRNLRSLARKVQVTCLLAHLRGVSYDTRAIISEQNLHPFLFDGARLALAHNGQLHRFDEMKFALLPHIRPDLARQIRGTTDTEWVYALVLSQLEDPYADHSAQAIAAAVTSALRVLRNVRHEVGIHTFSPMNLFLSDGNDLVAACFTFDFDNHDGLGQSFNPPSEDALCLWYTTGYAYGHHDGEWRMKQRSGAADAGESGAAGGALSVRPAGDGAHSCIVASEPLTKDRSTWKRVPMQHLLFVRRDDDGARVELFPIRMD